MYAYKEDLEMSNLYYEYTWDFFRSIHKTSASNIILGCYSNCLTTFISDAYRHIVFNV